MIRRKNEILKNWEKYKSFAFVKPSKNSIKKQNTNDSFVESDDDNVLNI